MALPVHVWSDVVCPWCFVGKRRLEAALKEFDGEVELVWHSFELDPGRTNERMGKLSPAERLAKKYGMPVARAETMMSEMEERGRGEGISFNLAKGETLQSFDAHRVLHFALENGKQDAMKERLFRAHFEEGVDCGSGAELVRLAGEVGLDVDAVASLLASDRYAKEVREDEQAARDLGISGVPFFVIGKYGISGAQSSQTLLQVLDRAYVEADGETKLSEGDACLPGEC